uniref:Uncharacterized protein n=1 Tax=Opuntia streptacantha TaxID=393608 RepID=A0A7C8ZR59_OPUST
MLVFSFITTFQFPLNHLALPPSLVRIHVKGLLLVFQPRWLSPHFLRCLNSAWRETPLLVFLLLEIHLFFLASRPCLILPPRYLLWLLLHPPLVLRRCYGIRWGGRLFSGA